MQTLENQKECLFKAVTDSDSKFQPGRYSYVYTRVLLVDESKRVERFLEETAETFGDRK